MFHTGIRRRCELINHTLIARGQMIVTAESCTGGLIAGALTDIPGSSAAVHGGFVTYSNAAKEQMIGVPPELIAAHGAVSEQVARVMAEGARRTTGATIAVAVTGIAGPGGGSEGKPVGLVHFACATADATRTRVERFGDLGRQEVRERSVIAALDLVIEMLGVKL
ncbi:MAG TPA: CinA family protein [Devosia sp.]|nr:CinA family protein [Devosia sp.]